MCNDVVLSEPTHGAGDFVKIDSVAFKDMVFGYDGIAPLFDRVAFEMPCGSNTLVTGSSGAGKSALLKILAGLLVPKAGSYLINGQDVCQMSFEEFLPFRKRIGYGFDYGGLLANRTLWDNLMLPLQYHNDVGFEEAEARVRESMEKFKLIPFKDRRPAAVSGAIRKATAIARSFSMRPAMLLLDDPFVGLDRDSIQTLFSLIESHREHHGLEHVFFTSRGENVSFKLANNVVTIEHGTLKTDASHLIENERKVANR